MIRGEIWIARAELYATKVRPVLLIQSEAHDTYESIITCLFTTFENTNESARVRIAPDLSNGLKETSYVMVDKIFSFDKADLDKRIGVLTESDMQRVSDRLRLILGL
jgi:mRNA interferase MazF